MKEEKSIHNQSAMPLLAHLRELRWRLLKFGGFFLVAFVAAFFVAAPLYDFLASPLAEVLRGAGRDPSMIYTSLPEVFFAYVRVALFGALCLSFPYGAMQLWLFIAPGLYHKEKRAFLPFLIATPFLFACGAFFAYTIVLPMAWTFFASFVGGDVMAMRLEAKVGDYLSLTMALIFSFGAAFLLPLLLLLLVRGGIVSVAQLMAWRRYAVVFAFVFAAVLTPPDVVSQILLAVPLILLYEGTLWLIRFLGIKHKR